MTDFVYDTFTDVDGTALTAHVGETGASWAWLAWGSYPDAIVISGAKLVPSGPATGWYEAYMASGTITDPNDFEVEAGFVATGIGDEIIHIAPIDPITEAVNNFLRIYTDSANTGIVWVGNAVIAYSHPGGWAPGQEYIVRVVSQGGTYTAYLDGVSIGSYVGATVPISRTKLHVAIDDFDTAVGNVLGLTYLRASPLTPPPPTIFWTSFWGQQEI